MNQTQIAAAEGAAPPRPIGRILARGLDDGGIGADHLVDLLYDLPAQALVAGDHRDESALCYRNVSESRHKTTTGKPRG